MPSSNSTAHISLRSSSASSSRADAVIHGVRPFAATATRPVPTAMFPKPSPMVCIPAPPLARRFESPSATPAPMADTPAETPATPVCNPTPPRPRRFGSQRHRRRAGLYSGSRAGPERADAVSQSAKMLAPSRASRIGVGHGRFQGRVSRLNPRRNASRRNDRGDAASASSTALERVRDDRVRGGIRHDHGRGRRRRAVRVCAFRRLSRRGPRILLLFPPPDPPPFPPSLSLLFLRSSSPGSPSRSLPFEDGDGACLCGAMARVAPGRGRPTARPLEAARETEATPPPTFAQPATETRTACGLNTADACSACIRRIQISQSERYRADARGVLRVLRGQSSERAHHPRRRRLVRE